VAISPKTMGLIRGGNPNAFVIARPAERLFQQGPHRSGTPLFLGGIGQGRDVVQFKIQDHDAG